MSDLSLRNTILEELEFQPHIDAAEIGVTVHNGVVTLTGHVSDYAQKVSAERAVKAVKGVRAVAEEIQVRLNKDAGTADDAIASRALHIIDWSSDLPIGAVKVIVENGWVSLEGQVDWQYQKETAERAVRKLSGWSEWTTGSRFVPRWPWPISSGALKKRSSAMPKSTPRRFKSRLKAVWSSLKAECICGVNARSRNGPPGLCRGQQGGGSFADRLKL